MIHSMTGFGRADGIILGMNIAIEMRSLNNRYSEIVIRAPRKWAAIEDPLREMIQKEVPRGKIDVQVFINEDKKSLTRMKINEGVIRGYEKLVKDLKKRFVLENTFTVGELLSLPDVFSIEEDPTDFQKLLSGIQKVVKRAIDCLLKSQAKEGMTLVKDLKHRVRVIDRNLKEILQVIPKKRKELSENLRNRIMQLLNDPGMLNNDRLEMEVALLAERADITEECVRLRSHLDLFLSILQEGGTVGKRLDFVLQEMHRESNTIGAKAGSYEISRNVVAMKDEIERLKEQVRNIM